MPLNSLSSSSFEIKIIYMKVLASLRKPFFRKYIMWEIT